MVLIIGMVIAAALLVIAGGTLLALFSLLKK
jgi:hypothetical protein